MAERFLDIFWSEKFWLPPNVTWKDIEPGAHGINHADYRDLVWPVPMAFVLIMFRFFTKRYILKPLGKSLGVKSSQLKLPTSNSKLELIYKKNPKLDTESLKILTKQLDLPDREIQRWWRRRKSQDKPTTLEKFSESCWQSVFYSCNFSFGLWVLWDKPYLWNISEFAQDYPHDDISRGVWWYYMISLAFYWSQTFLHITDNKRKDFWQMITHHIITLTVVSFSWVCNIHVIGTLLLVVHDCADIFLEAAKALKYAKLQTASEFFSGIFTITWIVTRLLMYPRLIYACIFQSQQEFFPAMIVFDSLLIMMLILHFVWTHMILQAIAKRLKKDGCSRDPRSSSSEIPDDDNEKKEK